MFVFAQSVNVSSLKIELGIFCFESSFMACMSIFEQQNMQLTMQLLKLDNADILPLTAL